jgi:hypothetical protein
MATAAPTVVAPNGTTSTQQADGSYTLAAPAAKPVDNTVVPQSSPLMVTSTQSQNQYGNNVSTLNSATGKGMPTATAPGQSTAAQLGSTVGAAPASSTTINIHPQTPTPATSTSTAQPVTLSDGSQGLYDQSTGSMTDANGTPLTYDAASGTYKPSGAAATGSSATSQPSGMDLVDPSTKQILQSNIDDLTSQATDAKAQVDAATATLNNDPAMLAAAAAIKAQYDQLIQAMTAKNAVVVGRAQTGVAAFGGLGQMSQNFMSDQMDKAQQRVADLQSQEADLINKSNEAYKSGDVKALNDAMTAYRDINTQKMTAINTLLKAATDATAQARQDKIDQQNLAHQNLQDALAQGTQNLAMQQDSIDNAFKQQTITETQRHNLATEAISRAAGGSAIGSGGGPSLPSVSMTASGTPDATAQASFLASLPGGATGDLATQIKGIANYTLNPADFSTRTLKTGGTITRAQIVTLAQQYDPSYNDQNFSVRQTYLKSLAPGGATYNAIVSANKAISHLTSYADTVSSIGNGGVAAPLNALGTAIVSPFAPALQSKTAQAQTEAAGVKDELAKFFKGSGATDVTSIANWSNQLNTNATPGELKGTVQGAITLLSGQLDVLNQKYMDTMGKAPTAPLLQPETIQKLSALKNQGYQVNIPGVYYTDPKAYLANGGSTDNLDAARTALTQAQDPNNPPTPENVLQLAQIMNQ